MTVHLRKVILTCLIIIAIAAIGAGGWYQFHEQPEHESFSLPSRYQHKKNGIIVLCYHRVLQDSVPTRIIRTLSNNSQLHQFNVPSDQFNRQMVYLHDHHIKVISATDMAEMVTSKQPIRGKYVVLTFDDIDRTVVDHAVPILCKYKLPFTTFIITGNTGVYREGSQMASWTELRRSKRQAGKLMTLGLHTHNMHYLDSKGNPVFTKAHTLYKFKRDFYQSRRDLFKYMDVRGTSFAYPYGSGTYQTNDFLRQQGLKWVATLNTGIVTDQTYLNETPRIIVNEKSWPSVCEWLYN